MALIVFITILYRFWRSYKECAFFLLWYLVFYLPISNLIPIANPVACHYMYLPSIGLLIVLAFFLDKVFKSTFLKKYSQSLLNILYVAIIMFCVTRTLVLNDDWKSDCDRGYAWIRDYPTDYQGYAMLGELYFNAGDVKKAKEYLGKSVLLNNQMPSDVLILAESYRLLGKSSIAESLLKQIILRHPNYQAPLFFLGEIYYDQKNNQQAQEVLEKALLLDPTNPAGYSLLKKVYLNLHKFESARNLLKRADFYLNEQNAL